MLNNYLKISARNLFRNKLFSFVSIAGFTVGLTVFLLILLFIHNELSYDSFHKNKDNIYRITLHETMGSTQKDAFHGSVPLPFTNRLKESFPQIAAGTNYLDENTEISLNGELSKEKVTFVDNDFFKIFSFKTLAGNSSLFGTDPSAVFITMTMAEKYFAEENPINKTIAVKIQGVFYDFVIRGVIDKLPENSSLKFNMLIPFVNAEKIMWIKFSMENPTPGEFLPSYFVMLNTHQDREIVESEFPKYIKPLIPKTESLKYYKPDLILCPLSKVHFNNELVFSTLETSDYFSVVVLGLIGLIILVIVSINYINLTVAQSSHRFKEIGIRKVIGAGRNRIIFQFLGESFVTIFISLFISLALAELLLPVFNHIINKELSFGIGAFTIISGLLLLSVTISLLAGAYPALVMSGLSPVGILKGTQKLSGSRSVAWTFITLQFIMSVVLISGAIIINRQYDFIMNKDLGYDKSRIMMIFTSEMFGRQIRPQEINNYKNEILNNPNIKYAANADIVLGGANRMLSGWIFNYKEKSFPSTINYVDYDFISSLKIRLAKGRNFSGEYETDSTGSVIVNETFVKEMGVKDPIGETVKFPSRRYGQRQIIGVVKDFNYRPLKEKIMPMAFYLCKPRSWSECLYVKFSSNDMPNTIKYLKKTWEQMVPGQVFNSMFLDDRLAGLYRKENQWKDIITYSSAIAIFFACLGLFGVVYYAAQKRTKEIGVRKILGASNFSLVKLLVKEFVILIAAAVIIGFSITYYLAGKWLSDFAYRIELNLWIFLITAGLLTAIVIITLLFISLRIAASNSVDNLRYE